MSGRRIIEMIPLSLRRALGGLAANLANALERRRLMWQLSGNAVECPLCGWRGKRFTDDIWHEGTRCPACRSDVRHRLLACVLRFTDCSENALIRGKDVLHFAPERLLRPRFQRIARRYVSADIDRADVDLTLDISSMTSVSDAQFDTVIACDVLEHVPADFEALSEIWRVLRPHGVAILTVPVSDNRKETFEDLTITSPAERIRFFGQHDHVRIYGQDFQARVEAAGFEVKALGGEAFTEEIASRYVLRPPRPSTHPLATNLRKIFICRRSLA